MKTDDFINMLASGAAPIDRWALAKRFTVAVLIGMIGATLLVALALGIRPDLAQVAITPIFWAKVALPLSLMIGALSMVMRLARPGITAGPGKLLVAAALLVVWVSAIYVLATASPDTRVAIIFGKTWRVCPLNITLLSVPGFIAIFWALRGLAPTDLRRAGACGGLLSGAMATLAYCLHCPEMEIPFWGAWYLLGMFIPAVIGASLGPRLLRW
jgi:hypothetical protein